MKSSLYFTEFNRKFALSTLLIITIIYLAREYLYKGINKFVVFPFGIDQIKQSFDLDILAVLLFFICIGRILYLIFYKRFIPTLNSLLVIILIVVCYVVVIRQSDRYYLQPLGFYYDIKYLDVFLFSILSLIFKFRYYGSDNFDRSINGFIEDDFHPEYSSDFLGRRKYAYQIGLKILGTKSLKKAFVIAVNSPWGFGKSGFLLLMEEFFTEKEFAKKAEIGFREYDNNKDIALLDDFRLRRKDVILIRYNPWKNFDDKKTVQDFFEELSYGISSYDSNLSKKIKSYSNYLYKLDDSIFSRIVEQTIDSFNTDKTFTAIFEDINIAITRIQKRIIVFIDDLDRLTGDELIDILKLIRNTANFRNTFFIVAYDHNYVLNTIEKRDLISNKEEYLQKIVQLEVTLPVFQGNLLVQFLYDELRRSDFEEFDFEKLKSVFNEILAINFLETPTPGFSDSDNSQVADFIFRSQRQEDSLLFKIFQNVRDVVRFVNSFKLSFESIGEIGDLYEIVMLEFLKLKYLSIYQIVASKKFLQIEGSLYQFDFEKFDNFWNEGVAKTLNIKNNEISIIRLILARTFSSDRKIYFRSVRYPKYFQIYFSYQTPGIIQLEEIEGAIKSRNDDQIIQIIDKSILDNTFSDLRSFLDSQTEFGNKDDFEMILKILFYAAKYDNRQ
jgi:hypothetical protein